MSLRPGDLVKWHWADNCDRGLGLVIGVEVFGKNVTVFWARARPDTFAVNWNSDLDRVST